MLKKLEELDLNYPPFRAGEWVTNGHYAVWNPKLASVVWNPLDGVDRGATLDACAKLPASADLEHLGTVYIEPDDFYVELYEAYDGVHWLDSRYSWMLDSLRVVRLADEHGDASYFQGKPCRRGGGPIAGIDSSGRVRVIIQQCLPRAIYPLGWRQPW